MKIVVYVGIALVVLLLMAASKPLAQAIAPAPVIRGVQCRVDYFVNNTAWEQVEPGGNLNVLYILKTTEQLPNGQFQTGVAVCWDDSQYNWNYTYR